ncbi:MAG: glycoside hydrolase family 2 protein [Calditrichaeota bacterium]|nr:glycoside hydrolase family 2 protein [Calditrichota bacterium]
MDLNTGWVFSQVGKKEVYPATVPGTVHTDLLANGLIPDPFYRDNEAKLQWIGKTDWEYRLEFTPEPQITSARHVELVFEGLDTYADVSLNGQPILKADNMFRQWRVDVTSLLRPGKNTLVVKFESAINRVLPEMKKRPFLLPAGNDHGEKTSPYTRKAPYHFGWDWGPRFVTCGIWRPVYLQTWDEVVVRDVHVLLRRLTDDVADLIAEVELEAAEPLQVMTAISSPEGAFPAVKRQVDLKTGKNTFRIPFSISQPRRWWPSGYGDQPLYRILASAETDGKTLSQKVTRIGLRTVELRQVPDRWGKSFEFVVNGVPIFAKGGNWIPPDNFLPRVSDAKLRWLLRSVVDANMNMLRVWGGGVYPDDRFFDLCDELGILVWQDFMFACSLYPADSAFLESVRHEAEDNVRRLRNHPSLVLWCGNNEVETGWFDWGWKNQYPESCWEDYKTLFHGLLPEVVSTVDPGRFYWPSSPSSNLEDVPQSQWMGDVHYWDVWHGEKPFTEYEKQFPRFMSEYGFQSFPLLPTVKTFAEPQDWDIESPVMTVHQKHPRGNQLIRKYMSRDWPVPKRFEDFLVMSQIVQAEGIKIGAEHLRRIKPRCMGSLYWQIDDCWPVASWSSIDYTGRWKALHYYARRFYAPVLVSPHRENGEIVVYGVVDGRSGLQGTLACRLLSFDGQTLWEDERPAEIGADSAVVLARFPEAEVLGEAAPNTVVFVAELRRRNSRA